MTKPSGSLSLLLQADPKADQAAAVGFVKAQVAVTVKTALDTPQISKLKKDAPGELAKALTRLLLFINAQLNIDQNKKLKTIQVPLLVQDMMTRYWYLKFDEIVYVLREGITGKYGRLFGAFDAMTVHEWFTAYLPERDEEIERRAYAERIKHKEGAKEVLNGEALQAFYDRSKTFTPQPDKKKPLPKNPLSQLEAFKLKCQGLTLPELKALRAEAEQKNPALTIIIQEMIDHAA